MKGRCYMYVFQSKLVDRSVSPNGDQIYTIQYVVERDSEIVVTNECVYTLTNDVGIVHDEEHFNEIGYDDELREKIKDHIKNFVITKSKEFK